MTFNKDYWSAFYLQEKPPWDMRRVSPPLKAYFDQLPRKDLMILIPGAGNAWEAEYLWQQGFKNVFVVDISPLPLQNFKSRVPDFPDEQLLNVDFFELKGQYDLIVEQVFFCALHPSQRTAYAQKMHELLKPGGKLAGVLYDFPLDAENPDPPFGGSLEEYLTYFKPLFQIKTFERCYNSHPRRQGRELFMILIKA
ncbi:Methyltransferase type 12 [Caldithrix abyssi DSM 13497]|uniref:Methyltransferase type 12 n=1 Tax=Caldithrix abyssi DSM 13497 TaxID=880073 RepID=H1XYA2_CALAY|nr:methyltransferase domain-containing protein [Caldithrix abyssi]APF19261.1 thiopurine S-methyltransferase [Caldithrix abyssi DSM 13497]EHO43169.1 Methyltransferase type 12 [Caldithrix abyssi DSM 13497]